MDAWVRSLMEHGDSRAAVCLGDECWAKGLADEAGQWYRNAAAGGDAVAMLRLAMLSASAGDQAGQRDWLGRAARAGGIDAAYRWAALRESESAIADARDWYRRAAEAGDWRARQALGRLDQPDPNAHLYDALVPRAGATFDVGSVVATVVVTLVVTEFVKTLAAKLAEDTYLGIRRWLKGLGEDARDGPDDDEDGNVLLVLEDSNPRRRLVVNLWLDAPAEALRSLTPERLRALKRRRRLLPLARVRRHAYWRQERGRWEVFDER